MSESRGRHNIVDFLSLKNSQGKLTAHALVIEASTGRSMCGYYDVDYLNGILEDGVRVNSMKEVMDKLGSDHFLYDYLCFHFNKKKQPFDVIIVDNLSEALLGRQDA